ncbi:MAG TPA: type IV toxin-antitoxin system AbiEi family antitoxin domain-containing protein [Candidatus Eisenbergiella stercoravium]|nr:type IV toxin-antitoxin system AbiEi family antitoxin domain-containing protein [Candidatus Eisenbergiella stercoravium]
MDQIWKQLKTLAETGDGFIRTSQVEEAGISRPMLKKYVDRGKLERVRKGIYVLSDGFTDEYVLLQAQSSKALFSYGTALFLWGMSDRTPHIIDVTVPHGTNMTVVRRDNPNLRCHYVQPELYELGITETRSP